ncbi:PucR family transcriptional regulator [Psychromicrobium lacuslunae]|uniref:PucR family transcriptional regulator n=1 Tax=Psychromicrobium lacuslunae TaxID=1618207 RepID=A0A0D4BVU0_9MICC|nr:PucR family transcriptional regulator [Psychromicrobium lacuslunae]AJT40444.1 hypothetical protein UM93_00730 [Psychromicrobium lacuslunae]
MTAFSELSAASAATPESLAQSPALPTVREVLAFSEFQRGEPEVLAARQTLDNPVRWVHILETSEIHSLLRGQELVLSTGAAWPTRPDALRSLAAALAEAKVSGLVLELSERLPHAPRVLVEACHQFKIPLVVLHRQIQFVVVTEHVHSMITAQQMAVLQAREAVNQRFAEMISRGVSSTAILQQCYQLLGSPVVLVDIAERVTGVQCADGETESVVRELLSNSALWANSAITAHGQHWGSLRSRLSSPQASSPSLNSSQPLNPSSAGVEYILSQAALTLAVDRLAAGSTNPWRTARDAQLIGALNNHDFASADEFNQLAETLGFPIRNQNCVGIVAEIPLQPATTGVIPTADTLAEAVEANGLKALVAVDSGNLKLTRLILILQDSNQLDTLISSIHAHWPKAKIAVGRSANDADQLSGSVREAISLLNLPVMESNSQAPAPIRYAETHQLRLLIGGLRHQHSLQAFVELTLGKILSWDAQHSGDLLEVLRAYLRHPANRTEAAAGSHLSRSVFYQRLALIEEILAVDLSSGEVISTLYSAVLAYDALR